MAEHGSCALRRSPSPRRRGIVPIPAAARSAPVRIPTTPGIATARRVSIARMSACASVDRTTTIWQAPRPLRLARNRPRPMRNRRSSTRTPSWLKPNFMIAPPRIVRTLQCAGFPNNVLFDEECRLQGCRSRQSAQGDGSEGPCRASNNLQPRRRAHARFGRLGEVLHATLRCEWSSRTSYRPILGRHELERGFA